MVKRKPKIVVENLAKAQLKEAYSYIKLDSPKNAEKVKAKILTSIKELADNPERHSKDKFRLNNDGCYRAFEIYKYRISYHISEEQITVIMIRHTKMEPRLH
jgi:plasmid stabilization system protein ParE